LPAQITLAKQVLHSLRARRTELTADSVRPITDTFELRQVVRTLSAHQADTIGVARTVEAAKILA
jgi:hypothetical protein